MTKQQGTWMNILMALFLGAVLGAQSLILQGNFTWSGFMYNLVSGFFVGYTIGDLVPAQTVGVKVVRKLKINEESTLAYFVSTAVTALILVTLISFFSIFVAIGFTEDVFGIWLKSYPLSLLSAYVVLLIILKPLAGFVMKRF